MGKINRGTDRNELNVIFVLFFLEINSIFFDKKKIEHVLF